MPEPQEEVAAASPVAPLLFDDLLAVLVPKISMPLISRASKEIDHVTSSFGSSKCLFTEESNPISSLWHSDIPQIDHAHGWPTGFYKNVKMREQ